MKNIKFKAVLKRSDGKTYVSEPREAGGLSYLFDEGVKRWGKFIEQITTEKRFIDLFPEEKEYLKGWQHIETIQYTGIKDINGVEIFNGDILKCWFKYRTNLSPKIEEVKILNTNCTLPFSKRFSIENKNYKDEYEQVEVVGNIYENKELLEENKMYKERKTYKLKER